MPEAPHDVGDVRRLAAALPDSVAAYASSGADFLRNLEYVRDYYLEAARAGRAMLLYLE
jgi:hypothetical protein